MAKICAFVQRGRALPLGRGLGNIRPRFAPAVDFSLFDLLSWYLVFLFSMIAHEASHAFAAWKLGDPTAHQGGQVTLDPAPHIRREPFGTVIVPLITYFSNGWMIGWASAPYSRAWAAAFPRRAAIMAAAGPAANLAIFLAAFVALKIGLQAGFFAPGSLRGIDHIVAGSGEAGYIAGRILSIAFFLNLMLFFFNLIPLPPLDGSAIVKLFLPVSATASYDRFLATPAAALGGLLIAWWVFPHFTPTLFRGAVGLLY